MVIDFPLNRGVFNGVIKYLIKANRTYQIGIKSSSKYNSSKPDVDNLLKESSWFYTERNDGYGQWIKMWFKNGYYIDLEGYSIKSHWYKECPNYWDFSVSVNGRCWHTIHKGDKAVSLDGETFSAKAKMVRYFKWTITGPSNYGLNYVLLGDLDVYGKYYYSPLTTHKKRRISIKILLLNWLIKC